MKRSLFLLVLLLFSVQAVLACRYTVREIGFSRLASTQYSLVIIDANAPPTSAKFAQIQNKLKDSNIHFLVLHPSNDNQHPAVIDAKESGISFPATLLWSDSRRIRLLADSPLDQVLKELLHAPMVMRLQTELYQRFAFVILIHSTDSTSNYLSRIQLEKACADITNRMPNMPKQVSQGPMVVDLPVEQFRAESTLLWSLGIDQIPEQAQAIIIYGRGRIMGDLLSYSSIMNGEAFKRLAMIGADCECGLDKKWMLGPQIPMNWPQQERQKLADELLFDVDNPLVLAEMSHILSKEQVANSGGNLSFAPTAFDLDAFLSSSPTPDQAAADTQKARFNPILIYIILSVLVLLIGSILFMKRNIKRR